MAVTIFPVIMAGGAGTRLWPMSTQSNPKQFQRLLGEHTLFQETVLRVRGAITGDVAFAAPSVIGGANYRELIEMQLAEVGVPAHRIVLEPFGRNTAPVAAVASAIAGDGPAGEGPADEGSAGNDRLVLLLPSDHFMGDAEAFRQAVAAAARATIDGGLVTTFGIEPTHPETGYGYIRRGAGIDGALSACDAFVEKPDRETALAYLADGRYAWNGGIFLFPPDVMARELAAHAPAILDATRAALEAGFAAGAADHAVTLLDPDLFRTCPDLSIDYAVMEKTRHAAVYGPLRCGWSDIGSWSALAGLDPEQQRGDVIAVGTEDCYLRSEDGTLLAAVGVSGLVVIACGGSVLVAPKDRVQEVKAVVTALRAAGRTDRL